MEESIKLYDAMDIAQHIVIYCAHYNAYCTNLRLQMTLYLIQEYFLKTYDRPCFIDYIVAAKFGPSVPDVYRHYRSYGGFGIIPFEMEEPIDIDPEDIVHINHVINMLSNLRDYELRLKILNQTPWRQFFERGVNALITTADIFEHPSGIV